MKIIVIGAGAWGTALAISASGNASVSHEVTLWARDAAQAAAMQTDRQNARYLPGQMFPERLQAVGGNSEAMLSCVHSHDLVLIATPMAGLRSVLTSISQTESPVAWLCKGFETASNSSMGLLAHEIQGRVAPNLIAGVLSGPSFAQEVAQGKPTALVAASAHVNLREALVAAFHSNTLRVYANDDLVGVEVGGAVKNVMAIATGLCDGLGLGLNARAALITRGLAEMSRLGLALGARMETFMGLSGLGDLVLTATGDLSRNRKIGLLLAQGQTSNQAVASLGHVAEGVYSARTVLLRAQLSHVSMPITQAVVDLLDGKLDAHQAISALMGRDPASESASA